MLTDDGIAPSQEEEEEEEDLYLSAECYGLALCPRATSDDDEHDAVAAAAAAQAVEDQDGINSSRAASSRSTSSNFSEHAACTLSVVCGGRIVETNRAVGLGAKPPPAMRSLADELAKLGQQRDDGTLSLEEFVAAKAAVLA